MNVPVKNRLHNNNTRAALNTLHFAIFLLSLIHGKQSLIPYRNDYNCLRNRSFR